jgi:hypothetical protein
MGASLAIAGRPAAMRVALSASRGRRGAKDTKKSLQEYASASGRRQGPLQIRMRTRQRLAVGLHDAAADVRRIRGDDAPLERGDERDHLDDRSRQHRRVENVGARFAAIARIVEAAGEERGRPNSARGSTPPAPRPAARRPRRAIS